MKNHFYKVIVLSVALNGCGGSTEKVMSSKVKASDNHYSFNVTAEGQTVKFTAVFRDKDNYGDSIELEAPASIKANGEKMKGIDAQGINAGLSLLLPIPFLFIGMPAYLYSSTLENQTEIKDSYSFEFTDQEGKYEEFKISSIAIPSIVKKSFAKDHSRKNALTVLTSVKASDDQNRRTSCILKSENNSQVSVFKSAEIGKSKGKQTCNWIVEELSKVEAGSYLLEISVSERSHLKGAKGYKSFTSIGKRVEISLQ